jgi:hypothetical protein
MDQGSDATVVRWEFTRGTERLVCQVEREMNAFAVILVSYRHLQRASIERFQAAAAALRRHAMLASRLRAEGWTLAGYTPSS